MLTGKGTRCCLVLLAAVCSRSADAQTWTQFEMNRCDAEDQSSPRPARPAGSAGATSFVPYFFDGFESYPDGAQLSAGKPFDAAGRTTASSDQARHGRHSARMAIHQGDQGGYGRWGGVIPVKPALPRGGEIWVRLYVYWPQDFQFTASPWMKSPVHLLEQRNAADEPRVHRRPDHRHQCQSPAQPRPGREPPHR